MTASTITRHGERFATDLEDGTHTNKVKVSSTEAEPVVTSLKSADIETLISTNNSILKQLKIMNFHLALMSDQFISADDI